MLYTHQQEDVGASMLGSESFVGESVQGHECGEAKSGFEGSLMAVLSC